MNVTYNVLLEDPNTARTRHFRREAGPWPFPSLPAPGDAVSIDMPARLDVLAGDEPAMTVSHWSSRRPMQTRALERVVYDPLGQVAHLVFRVAAMDDPEPQVEILTGAGFHEVPPVE